MVIWPDQGGNKEVAFLLFVVTPVLSLLRDVSTMGGLGAAPCEVVHIFHLPPETLIDPELARKEILMPLGSGG